MEAIGNRYEFVFLKKLSMNIFKGIAGHFPSIDTLETRGHEVGSEQEEETGMMASAFPKFIKKIQS